MQTPRTIASSMRNTLTVPLNRPGQAPRRPSTADPMNKVGSTQTALRSFKPPFWKLESKFRPIGDPECPQTLDGPAFIAVATTNDTCAAELK